MDWQRSFPLDVRLGLDRMEALVEALGHPEREFTAIHVAGTNGKGSTAAMIAAALQAEGLRVGMTVSPDLGELRERVLIDGRAAEPAAFQAWQAEVERAAGTMEEPPTFFEAMVALAFLAFARAPVDVAVVEVGLGGGHDATNVLPPPLVSVITPIHYDHMDRLGARIEQIAAEKAGILKPGSRLVLAPQPLSEARAVVRERARERRVPVREPGGTMGYRDGVATYVDEAGRRLQTALRGRYQTVNLATAWTAVRWLHELRVVPDLDRAAQALETVRWPGRFQIVAEHPLTIVDGAHNLHGAAGLAETLADPAWRDRRWHLVFAGLEDKPGVPMLKLLAPHTSHLILTSAGVDRAADPAAIGAALDPALRPEVIADPGAALAAARARAAAEPGGAVLVTGSLALLSTLRMRGLIDLSV